MKGPVHGWVVPGMLSAQAGRTSVVGDVIPTDMVVCEAVGQHLLIEECFEGHQKTAGEDGVMPVRLTFKGAKKVSMSIFKLIGNLTAINKLYSN